MSKKCNILITGLLIVHTVFAQNLVPNGDFELYSVLPNDYGQSNRATGWNNVNGFYTGPPFASPDYFNTAGAVPTALGQIAPFSGNGQMGFVTNLFFITNFREYISTTLVSPLVPGMQYKVSFALSNGNNGEYTKSTNNIGLSFSTGPFFQLVDQPITTTPQIEIATITYNANFWQSYTYFFTASSAYTHITIGNFRDDANTLISPTGSSGAYYFIDKIVVEKCAIVLSETTVDASCGNSNGSINLSVSGGSAPYTYLWSNGATTEDITGLAPNNYTVSVTNSNGCTSALTISITNTTSPNISSIYHE